ncbi:MAG: DUF5997 family protein [Rhodoglobus sp.]|nr:DUF5997 family protein [Rhodoglobus sp.]
MKPATAAKKLGILLTAAPADFQDGVVTRTEFLELQSNPPEWLAELRRTGPHPKQVVAQKLGISVSGLARSGAPDSMMTAEIKHLLETKPEWLVVERATQAAVHEENARIKFERRAKSERRDGGV